LNVLTGGKAKLFWCMVQILPACPSWRHHWITWVTAGGTWTQACWVSAP